MEVLAGADFFTVEVLTWRGLVTYYILFFIEVGTRRVYLGGITRHPGAARWLGSISSVPKKNQKYETRGKHVSLVY
jgi:hypothetical protein